MKKIEEIRTHYVDQENNNHYVDVYYEGHEDTNSGEVACVICGDTGKTFYRNPDFMQVKEVVSAVEAVQAKVKKALEAKAPKLVAVISGGILQSVIGEAPVDLHVIDYDCEDEAPEDCYEIPQGNGRTETAYAYIGEIFEENAERTKELLNAINR